MSQSPALKNAIARAEIKREIKSAESNLRYWSRRKIVDLKTEDKIRAGGLVIAWESQIATLQAKLTALN